MELDKTSPYIFDEFFASGKEESVSPFLTPSSKKWAKDLPLKASLLSAGCLLISFLLHFSFLDLSHIFLLLVYVISGTPALINSIEDLWNLDINIDVLMTLAALLSVLIGSGIEGALLLVLFEFSGAMEHAVTQKTKSALISLHELSPSKAHILSKDGHLIEKSVKEIAVGTPILIKEGEIVPLDGVVFEGSSFVNLSHLTGESVPLAKKVGDTVPAGARNLDGTLMIKVTTSSQDSTLSKIIRMISEAQEAKPQLQKWIDRFGKGYAITIILLTTSFALFLPFFIPTMPHLGFEGSIYRALTFLIAASPCALVIATPTAYLSAISSCARRGILLKGGAILDALASCKHIAFDKTGTLTTGKLRCIELKPVNEEAHLLKLDLALSIAGSMERSIKHPMADAVIEFIQSKNLQIVELNSLESIPGSGIKALYQSKTCYLGNEPFVLSKLKEFTLPDSIRSSSHIGSESYLLIDKALFVFHFEDDIRSEVKPLLSRLIDKLQMNVTILTGDQKHNALNVAKELGVSSVFSNLRPQDKLDKVAELSKDHGLIMIGDGVNDAPALARATVGISMGQVGSTAAIDASDVVFLQDEISSLDWLIGKSHKTMRIIKQNLSLALVVILFATSPALLGWIPLWAAVLLHEGGTVLVGFNSLRLLKTKK
jgi:heavy metal translocating P-type ATPase